MDTSIEKTTQEEKINSRNSPINLALLFISIFFSLLLLEMGLRLMGWSPMYVSPERDRFWKYDPLLGWAHQPGQEGIFETPQFRTTVRINLKGLRDREHAYERSDDSGRVLVIGDSFAWGYGVEESQRFSQLLETSMGVEVINAGVSGYSTDQELLWLRNEGIKYDPDLVILVLSGNDIGDNSQQLVNTIYYKPQFVKEEGRLILIGYPVPKTGLQGKLIYYLSQRSALSYFLVQRYFNLLSVYRNFSGNFVAEGNSDNANPSNSGPSSTREPFELTQTLLHEISKIAESREARFMIVATDRWWNAPSGQTYKDFIEALHSEGFLVLDVESIPGFDPGEMLIPDDGHWNKAGHEFAAQAIMDFIKRYQLLFLPQNQDNTDYLFDRETIDR